MLQMNHCEPNKEICSADAEAETQSLVEGKLYELIYNAAQGLVQRNGTVDAKTVIQHNCLIFHRDNRAAKIHEYELVNAVCKVSQYHSSDHFLTLSTVEQLASQYAQQHCNGYAGQECHHYAGNAHHLIIQCDNQACLS